MQERLTFKPVDDFLQAWKVRNLEKMLELTTHTFRSNAEVSENLLHLFMNDLDVKKWKILLIEEEEVCHVLRDVTVELTYFKKSVKMKANIKIRCVKETEPYKTNIKGEWLVNPISATKGI